MTEHKTDVRAFECACSWMGEIRGLLKAEDEAQKSGDGAKIDEITNAIQQSPLGVVVRSGWVKFGKEMEPAEYIITLTTGGPAVRLCGDLSDIYHPYTAHLEYQDWFEPWKELTDITPENRNMLLRYANEISPW